MNSGTVFSIIQANKIVVSGGTGNPLIINVGLFDIFGPKTGLKFGNINVFEVSNIWFKGNNNSREDGITHEGGNVTCSVKNSIFTQLGSAIRLSSDTYTCDFSNNLFGIRSDGTADPNDGQAMRDFTFMDSVFKNNTFGTADIASLADPFSAVPGFILEGDRNIFTKNKFGQYNVGLVINGKNNNIHDNVISNQFAPTPPGGFPPDTFFGSGIFVNGGERNEIWNNKIGTDITGNNIAGNSGDGIHVRGTLNCIGAEYNDKLSPGVEKCLIAGAAEFNPNIISANGGNGVFVMGPNNFVLNNIIGANNVGQLPNFGNGKSGILVKNSAGIEIKNNESIGGNLHHGVELINVTDVLLAGLRVGTNDDGLVDLGNNGDGIHVDGGKNITIGGISTASVFKPDSIISGNSGNGIEIFNSSKITIFRNSK